MTIQFCRIESSYVLTFEVFTLQLAVLNWASIHFVVGDVNRNGSIVLAATPPLKAMGIKKMARLYEIPCQKDILIVNPIMGTYIKCSNYITKLALQYVPIEDFHQYSIDEFFMDITDSIHLFARDPYEFALQFKREVYEHTRIECTIGIAPNLLMSKVALRLPKITLYINKKRILALFMY